MIEINNLTNKSLDEAFFKKIVKMVLKEEGEEDSSLSLALVSQTEIKKINKEYRGKNKATDVLSFLEPNSLKKKFGKNAEQIKKISGLGEIIICLQEVKENAEKFDSSFNKELARVFIHGILHLLGYNHEENEREAKKMEAKEEYYLSQIRI